jgi:hypothetical protein
MSEAKPRLMTCDEFDALLDLGDPLSRSEAARQHAVVCPRCRALAGALSEARSGALPASALAKAEAAAALNLTPVRSLRSPLIAAAGTLAALACLLVAGVLVLGTHGWAARLPWQRSASYLGAGSVLVLSLAAALREREPGLSLAAPWRYAAAALATMLWAGPFVLYEFRPESRFWRHGSLCCCEGLLVGFAAGMVIWLVMRRGYLLSPLRAGWFAGIAAGCLAFIVQETYCPVVDSGHSALWHGGVVAVLGAAGWIAGWRVFQRD